MTLSNFRMFLRMSKLRASTFCCAFSSALLIQGWTIASSSLRPSLVSMPSSLSEPKMRIRSSSSDRKNLERPGSPWRPERPRSWLSMRRLSWRSVPSTNSPPAFSAFSFSRATCDRISAAAASRCAAFRHVLELLADAHVGVAAELNVGAAAGHVGGDGDRARHAGLRDDVGLLLVVARVEDGEHLGLAWRPRRRCRARRRRSDRRSRAAPSPACAASRQAARTSRSRWCRPAPAGRVILHSSISVRIARYFSAAVR